MRFIPLTVGIEKGDEREGSAAKLLGQTSEFIEALLPGSIQNAVGGQGLDTKQVRACGWRLAHEAKDEQRAVDEERNAGRREFIAGPVVKNALKFSTQGLPDKLP
jgi:hypothetical protein